MKTTKFICGECNCRFEVPTEVYDSYGTSEPEKFDKRLGCPFCKSDRIEKQQALSKDELSQYIYLKRETERMSERLLSNKDNVELYELVQNNKLRCMALMLKTQSYIYSIDDSLTRQIFELRYIKGLKWAGVAAELGGYLSEDYVRIVHDRFLKSNCK